MFALILESYGSSGKIWRNLWTGFFIFAICEKFVRFPVILHRSCEVFYLILTFLKSVIGINHKTYEYTFSRRLDSRFRLPWGLNSSEIKLHRFSVTPLHLPYHAITFLLVRTRTIFTSMYRFFSFVFLPHLFFVHDLRLISKRRQFWKLSRESYSKRRHSSKTPIDIGALTRDSKTRFSYF